MPKLYDAPIATRMLDDASGHGGSVRVSIGRPTQRDDGDWSCPYRIEGQRLDLAGEGYGIDALQALVQAIEGARVALEGCGRTLTWQGGEQGDTGFPRHVPAFLDRRTARRIETLIDREIEAWSRQGSVKHP